jgi:hypothetical protein
MPLKGLSGNIHKPIHDSLPLQIGFLVRMSTVYRLSARQEIDNRVDRDRGRLLPNVDGLSSSKTFPSISALRVVHTSFMTIPCAHDAARNAEHARTRCESNSPKAVPEASGILGSTQPGQ